MRQPGKLKEELASIGHFLAFRDAARIAGAALAVTAPLFAVALAVALMGPPGWSESARMAAAAVVLAGVVAPAAAWLRFRPDRELAEALDRRFGLPDSALAACELGDQERPGPWAEATMEDFPKRLKAAQPVCSPAIKPLVWRLGGFAVLAAAWIIWVPSLSFAPEKSTTMENMLPLIDALELHAEEIEGPAAEELRLATESLRERQGENPIQREDVLVEIGRAEDRLEASLQDIAFADPAVLAKSMESSVDPIASAIARGNSKEALEEARAAFDSTAGDEAGERFSDLARRLEAAGFQSAAIASRSLAGASDDSERAEALAALEAALGGEAGARITRKELEMALMQLEATREAVNNSSSRGGLDMNPKAGEDEKGSPGGGAGSDNSSVAEGSPPDESPSKVLPLMGHPNPSGDSSVLVMPSATGSQQTPRTTPSEAEATAGPLSGEAVNTESLPPAHRAIVRRYFESLRPQPSNP